MKNFLFFDNQSKTWKIPKEKQKKFCKYIIEEDGKLKCSFGKYTKEHCIMFDCELFNKN